MSKHCPYCGTELPDTALNCANCGAPQSNTPQPNPYPPQPSQQMVPVPTIKDFLKLYWLPFLLNMVTCGIGGTIMMIVWACDRNNPVRKNYACANLISIGITIGVYVLLYAVIIIVAMALGFSLTELGNELYY